MGGSAAAADKVDDSPKEVLIDGKLYDVSAFRHPGGSIVKFLQDGGDATEAFTEFHMRSKKANLVLKSLPKRDAPAEVLKEREFNKKAKLSKDFAELRAGLEKDGFFEPSVAHCVYRIAEIAVMHAVGAYMVLGMDSTLSTFLGLALLGCASGRCGWLMHEGGHYSMSGNIHVDRLIQIFIYGVGCGMSGMWWRNQHNKHHATPQKLKHDVDLDTLPLIAFNSAVINSEKLKHKPLLRGWLKMQGFLFVPVSCLLVATGWQMYLHPRHIHRVLTSKRSTSEYRKQAAMELGALVVRYALLTWLLCARGNSSLQAFGMYTMYNFFGASYIFVNFAMSHTHLPVTKEDEFLHWVEYSALHTTNLNAHPITNWWMSYLNFQIEHHLFPSMPQFRHPETSKRVRAMFEKNGLKYDSRPYWSCMWETMVNLHDVGQEAAAASTGHSKSH